MSELNTALRESAVLADASTDAPSIELPSNWALVDHFDLNGRRYFVVATGQFERADPLLSPRREHQVASLAKLGYSNKAMVGSWVSLPRPSPPIWPRSRAS